ncbi:AAEL004641-PA [Aedes aegypti]|uniref:AAEL004641-PA n=1 Tax=Aedes aegypti TaxID=7159 RepID=Q17CB0_AEDAE|nr:AAEL004641-PA [Aedes aegypti]
MEPTIKIEEDSVEFDEYAFYSAHNVKTDESSEDDKQNLLLTKPKRSAARLQIEDLFQISSVCSQNRNLLKQPFPIQTVNELNELDTLLLGNPTFMEKCAQMLHNAIQNEALENVTGHMRLLLEFAIDYSVLLKYSWFGFLPRSPIARNMGEQQPFRNLIGVIHLLHRARRLRFGKCSLEEIHEGIEKFLKRKLRCHALFVKKQNYVIQGTG